MTTAPTAAPQDRLWPWALSASVVLPMVLYTLTAAPGPYWLDSSELVAASFIGGVPHPPGHPLYTAMTQPLGLVPLGSIALRMNLASGLFGALACGVLAWTLRTISVHHGMRPGMASIGAAITAMLTATSYAVWFQAVRAEVYTLHLLTAAGVVALATRMELDASEGRDADPRLLYTLAFVLGLGLANHHYLVVFLGVPILGLLLARGVWRRALFSLHGLKGVGLGVVGLATYVLLPLRAATAPMVNWGDPDTPGRFWWVLTAQAFQKSLDRAQEVDVPRLLFDLFGVLARQMTPLALVLALAGWGWLMASPKRRGLGWLLGAVVVFNLLTKSLMNFDPFNPDLHGYFALAIWTIGLLVGVCWLALDRLCAQIAEQTPEQAAIALKLPGGALVCLTLILGANAFYTLPDARLDGFRAVELTNAAALDSLPKGSVVLTSNFKTIFNVWYAQSVEQRRLDVTFIHRNFLPTRGYADEILARYPEMKPLVKQIGPEEAELDTGAMLAMSAQRPVYFEYDVNISPVLARHLVPDGVFLRVTPEEQPEGPLPEVLVKRQRLLWEALERRLDVHAGAYPVDAETKRYMVWTHYLLCRAMLDAGHPVMAMVHLDRAMAINPTSPQLLELFERFKKEQPLPAPPR